MGVVFLLARHNGGPDISDQPRPRRGDLSYLRGIAQPGHFIVNLGTSLRIFKSQADFHLSHFPNKKKEC